MMSERVWSHSSLNCIMNNPAEFYLVYVCGIKAKKEKTALSLGSAVHWGLEHNTSDLTEYYNEKGSFKQWNNYTEEQLLAECMVESYLNKKNEIYDDILKDNETGEKLQIIEEVHELTLNAQLYSVMYDKYHKFMGILDLLFLTNKGLVLLDYKTSSKEVDYDEYKSQLYKYIYLLKNNFPGVPIYKMGIVNLKKTQIRRKKSENDESFKKRIKDEYDLNEDNLIEWHTYLNSEFDDNQLKNYSNMLSQQIDIAETIENKHLFFVNYSNIKGMYGPSQYYDIFYNTKDNYLLYTIKDSVYDEFENKVVDYRECDPIDMLALNESNILNKFELFDKEVSEMMKTQLIDKQDIFKKLKQKYKCSDKLLETYYHTYQVKSLII